MRPQTLLLTLLLLAASTLSYPHLSLRSLTLPTLESRQCSGKIACYFKKKPTIITDTAADDAARAALNAAMMAASAEGAKAAETACNPYMGKC